MILKDKLKNWYVNFTQLRWTIGVAEFDSETILNPKGKINIHWVKHNSKDSWFADPFILSMTDDRIHILVEEFMYSLNRGRISKLTVNRHNWQLEKIEPVIEQKTHMSFPAYYRDRGKVYLYPENTNNGKLTLFEYDEETGIVVKVRDISNLPLADAVICNLAGQKVIMATTAPNDSSKKLDIYPYSNNPDAPPSKTISFSTNVARNAGFPFEAKGHTIRPAQDCSRYYGSCVVLQEVVEENGLISFKEIRRLYSRNIRYSHAFHTFNVFDNKYISVDAEGFRYGILAQLVFHIREFFKR